MVGRWGMSAAVGPLAVIPRDGSGPLLPGVAQASEQTQELVDSEVKRIVDEAHTRVGELLHANRDKLDGLVAALLEHERWTRTRPTRLRASTTGRRSRAPRSGSLQPQAGSSKAIPDRHPRRAVAGTAMVRAAAT